MCSRGMGKEGNAPPGWRGPGVEDKPSFDVMDDASDETVPAMLGGVEIWSDEVWGCL